MALWVQQDSSQTWISVKNANVRVFILGKTKFYIHRHCVASQQCLLTQSVSSPL
jgi:hypothetical protein